MSDLPAGRFTNLYGSPNPSALVILRGGGEFVNWQDHKKVRYSSKKNEYRKLIQEKEVGERWICSRHEHELGWNWDNPHFHHFKIKHAGYIITNSHFLKSSFRATYLS